MDVLKNWIDEVQYSHSKSKLTGERYQERLKAFCDFVETSPEQIVEEYERGQTYLAEKRFKKKWTKLLRRYVREMDRQGYAPNTIISKTTAVISFFKYSDLPLGNIPIVKSEVVFHNRPITKEEIAQILAVSRPRDRAFFCVMAQSGLRPNTLVKLKYKDIQEDFENETIPLTFKIRKKIAKGKYISFITFAGEDSLKHLKAYLMKRPNIQPNDYLFTSHGTDKKLSARSISLIFKNTVEKLEKKGIIKNIVRKRTHTKDGSTKYVANIRLYSLRKFFRNQAGPAGTEFVNSWMGHKVNYRAPNVPSSDEYYFDKTNVEFHRKKYIEKAMPNLRIEEPTPSETEQTIEELREQLKQKEGLIQAQEKRLQSLEKFQKDTLAKMSEYAAFARELKSLLPEKRRKEIIEKLQSQKS